MPAKKHKAEEIIGKLREVEIVLGQIGTTAEGSVSPTGQAGPGSWYR